MFTIHLLVSFLFVCLFVFVWHFIIFQHGIVSVKCQTVMFVQLLTFAMTRLLELRWSTCMVEYSRQVWIKKHKYYVGLRNPYIGDNKSCIGLSNTYILELLSPT